jgi:hypothetical protein
MIGTGLTRRGSRIVDPLCVPVSLFHCVICGPWQSLLTHADHRPLLMKHDSVALHARCTPFHNLRKPFIEGIREPNVSNNSSIEKSEWADPLGAVNDLVRHDKVHGLDLLLQGPDGGEGDDAADADRAQRSDVGPHRDLVRGNLVVHAVAGEERDRMAVVLEDLDRGAGGSPWRFWG